MILDDVLAERESALEWRKTDIIVGILRFWPT